jgi:hypothetical protein
MWSKICSVNNANCQIDHLLRDGGSKDKTYALICVTELIMSFNMRRREYIDKVINFIKTQCLPNETSNPLGSSILKINFR